jgi:hypothetical protein
MLVQAEYPVLTDLKPPSSFPTYHHLHLNWPSMQPDATFTKRLEQADVVLPRARVSILSTPEETVEPLLLEVQRILGHETSAQMRVARRTDHHRNRRRELEAE